MVLQHMRAFSLAIMLAAAFSLSAATSDPFPDSIAYQGFAADAEGIALSGKHDVAVRLLAVDGSTELAKETISSVRFKSGQFKITLGSQADLKEIAKGNPEFLLEVTIAEQTYGPLVRVLPAGHSMKSRATLSGPVGGEDKLRSKFFDAVGPHTSFQAATLSPTKSASLIQHVGDSVTNPFELAIRGPQISRAVRDLPSVPNRIGQFTDKEVNPPRHEELYDDNGNRFGTIAERIVDPLAAQSANHRGVPTPDPIQNFAGVANVNGVLPPDIEGAVGPDHYVQMVNLSFAVYDKSGTLLAGPSNNNTLWSGFGGSCESDNSGDAIALYDQLADRWILTQFAVSTAQSVCFAVSTTSDPMGTYYLYELPSQRFPDYYKLGMWPDPDNNAIFMGTNSGFAGAYDVYAIDRASLLAGRTPRPAQFFQSYPNLLMPADFDGGRLPPAGSPGLLYTIREGGDPYFTPVPPNDSIDLYAFDVDWDTPANTTLTLIESFGPPDIAEFNWTVCGFFVSDCLEQPDTAVRLDSGSWWPMQRFQYRQFNGNEILVGAWTVDVNGTGDHAAPRWFELQRSLVAGPGSGWTVAQQGTHAPDAAHRWEPSISMNGDGDIGMAYSVVQASTDTFASIRYAGRRDGDPAGVLRDEAELIAGAGAQTSSSNRWGDYASMDVDPADDCTFWFTSEHIQTTGGAPWETQIGSFQFAPCASVVIIPATTEMCAADGTGDFPLSLASGFNATTNLSVANCPAGATCGFSVNPVVNPATDSVLELSSLAGVSSGNYVISVMGVDSVDGSLSAVSDVLLSIVDSAPGAPTLSMPADGATDINPIQRQFDWDAIADAEEYLFELASDPGFTNIVDTAMVGGTTYVSDATLDGETTYYWRVSATNLCGPGVASAVFDFVTAPVPGECPSGLVPVKTAGFDFESGEQGWTHTSQLGSDTWALSGANPNSGSQHWHADDVETDSDQLLISPPMALQSGRTPLTLQFWNFQDMESNGPAACWDGGVLEISTDGGANFSQVAGANLQSDPYDGPFQSNSVLFGEDGWCGDPQPYLNSVVDLNAFAGQTVEFRFRIATDGAVSDYGWDIDDVMVQGCDTDDVFDDSFGSGGG